MSELLSCPMCSYCTAQTDQLLSHVCQIHEHDPNFLVYCNKCSRSFRKLESYRKHKFRSSECSDVAAPSSSSSIVPAQDPSNDLLDTCPEDLNPVACHPSTKWQAARFLLSIKAKHDLSQAAVDTIVTSTTSLVGTVVQDVLAGVREELPEEAKRVLDGKIQEGAFDRQLFEGLGTPYLQKKYFRESLKLVVSIITCLYSSFLLNIGVISVGSTSTSQLYLNAPGYEDG